MKAKDYCLHICRWYPDPDQPDLGNFVKHHITASSMVIPAVVVYVRKSKTPFFKTIEGKNSIAYLAGVKASRIPLVNALKRYLKTRQLIKLVLRKYGPPALVHAHLHTRPVLWASRLSEKFGIPFYITEHWSGYCNGKFQELGRWKQRLIKRHFAAADKIMPVSQFLAEGMQNCGIKGDYQVVPNLVYPLGISRRANMKNYRFMFVGDFRDEIKNISGILRSFASLNMEADLHLIGAGADLNKIKSLCKDLHLEDKVSFFGLLPHRQVIEKLAYADCLLVNSRIETFSVIAAEAVSMAIPVICTRCGGPENFLSDETGILIPVDDNEELEQAMKLMLTANHGLPSAKATQNIRELFSLETISNHFRKAYNL